MHRSFSASLRRATSLVGASLLATTLPLLPGGPVSPPHAGAIPADFTRSVVGSVGGPTTIEQLPDGRVVIAQQGGQIRLVVDGAVQPTPALSLAVCSGGERGLLGFTADPDFSTNGVVYLYYTRTASGVPGGCVNRVSRFVMTGSTISMDSEVVLIDNISSVNSNHNGGDLFVGLDGYLYVAVGDAGRDPRGDSGSAGGNDAAQDLSLLNGKILRVDRTSGQAPFDNPLVASGAVACRTRGNTPSTPMTPCAEIYAWGLRNPWRTALDPNTGPQRFFINDVGQGTREEVDLGVAGGNYGWNSREGQCPQGTNPPCPAPPGGVIDPITDYAHTLDRSYITAGAFVPNGVWPREYDGGYLFADGGSGEIWLRTNGGNVDYSKPFATGAHGISDMAFVREGGRLSLWYVTAGSSDNVIRLAWTPPAAAAAGPLAFSAVATTRLLDTREVAAGNRPLTAGTTRYVATGLDGSETRAVLVSIAIVSPTRDGFLTAWAGRTQQPTTANVNAVAGEVVSNMSVVPLDGDGGMLLYTLSNSHVVVDLLGRFDRAPNAVSAGRFQPVVPSRVADTREVANTTTNRYTRLPGTPYPRVNVPMLGRGGIPTSGVSSVVLVVTGLSDASLSGGFLTATPGGAAWPGTANLTTNGSNDIRPNTVVVPVGTDGSIDLHLMQIAHVVVDVAGWFTDTTATTSSTGRFMSIPPTREIDTRIALGFATMPSGSVGWIDPGSVPSDAVAIAQNIAITGNVAAGFITPFPGGSVPLVAAGNVTGPGQTRSIHTFTRLGSDGRESYFTLMATDLVVDITGWFTP